MRPTRNNHRFASSNAASKLSPDVRIALEGCFGTSLGDVELHQDDRADSLGLFSFALGNRIHLSRTASRLSKCELLPVLAHECAHVIQQRQGRVKTATVRNGVRFCIDPILEAEANDAADRAVRGESISLVGQFPFRTAFESAVQPLISVHGEIVKFSIKSTAEHKRIIATNLSEKFVKMLSLVDGSIDWLNWAANKTPRAYLAESELTLLLEMVEGLHNSPLLRLPGIPLVLHAARLWDLPRDDFFTLAAGSASPVTDKILAAHGLISQTDLALAASYFQELTTDNSTLWVGSALADQISLYKLYSNLQAKKISKAAIANMSSFAESKAATPQEFVDWSEFYLAAATKLNVEPEQKTLAVTVTQTWQDVLKLAVCYLNAPSLGMHWRKSHLETLLRNWIETGGEIGFQTSTSAAVNIVRNSRWMKVRTKPLEREEAVVEYMASAQALLYSSHPKVEGMTQDGENHRFRFQSGPQQATISIDSLGTVTIEEFTL